MRRNIGMTLVLALASIVTLACSDDTSGDSSSSGTDDATGAETDDDRPGDNDNGEGASTDTGDPVCEPLTDWEQMMLDAHNEWRATVDPPAADMYRVYWDLNIAQNAADWVSSCDPDWPHSSEESRSNVGGYEVLGENLSYCAGTGCSELPTVTDGSGLGDGEGWWDERHDYHWADDSSTGVTSHYTQMVSSNVYAIGCATQECSAPGPGGWDGNWWWTICQYGPRGQGYWAGTKPYEMGAGGLIEPEADKFEQHPGLCSP